VAIVVTSKVFLARLSGLTKPKGPFVPITPTEAIISLLWRDVRWGDSALSGGEMDREAIPLEKTCRRETSFWTTP